MPNKGVSMTQPKKIVVTTFVKNLLGGGAERVAVNLLQGLPQDVFTQELVMVSGWGPFVEHVPGHVKTLDLAQTGGVKDQGNVSAAIWPLVRYLRERKPDVLISHLAHANVAAVIATVCAQVGTKVVLVEHNDNTPLERGKKRSLASKAMQGVKAQVYKRADRLVGVSEGVSSYIGATFAVPKDRITTIYNPVISQELLAKADEPLEHPWFVPGAPPVLLASGRLREQKDFVTLLRAFARVRAARPCRLIILGEGQDRGVLEAEVEALGLRDAVQLPGFVPNPYPYMRAASLFVLSSRWEGLPTVLIEALACGCPVVSTDCPSGPHEILEGGRWGPLVPVADPDALAEAILVSLGQDHPRSELRGRAQRFSFERALDDYTALLRGLARPAQGVAQSLGGAPLREAGATSGSDKALNLFRPRNEVSGLSSTRKARAVQPLQPHPPRRRNP